MLRSEVPECDFGTDANVKAFEDLFKTLTMVIFIARPKESWHLTDKQT